MNWAIKYQAKRDQYWPDLEQFFAQLPPHLFRQSVLLRNNLATFYSDSGQFQDILRRERDHPLLYLHFWLLDDWNYPAGAARSDLEKHLFLAQLFAFAAVYTHESILDPDTNFDNTCLFLAQTLSQQAGVHLAHLFPGASPFWTYQRAFWQEYAEAVLMTAGRRERSLPGGAPAAEFLRANFQTLPGNLAFTKIPLAAVALTAGRENLLPELCALLDRFNTVFQIMRQISAIRRDLAHRNLSYPILKTMAEAGLDPLQPLPPEQILGAMVLSGSIAGLCRENLAELAKCRTAAQALHLPGFAACLTGLEAWIAEVQELFSLKDRSQDVSQTSGVRIASRTPLLLKTLNEPKSPIAETTHFRGASPLKPPKPLFAPHADTLPKVIEMAEGYLLSDLTFRESWEVQRRGVFGVAELTGKAFPMGLIVEILCRHGHDMAAPIDQIFETLQATGFRYYDHPHLPPDADDLGLLLRLWPYSRQPERHQQVLQIPLHWLESSLGQSGEIPVWLKPPHPEGASDYPFLSLWGHSCATVEANALLGLIAYDRESYGQLIDRSARRWCEQVAAKGLSATRHYVPLYALWVAFELIARLKEIGLHTGLNEAGQNLLELAARKLAEHLAIEANRPGPTPQEAAFLTLACLSPENQQTSPIPLAKIFEVYLPQWITHLCKSQRYDGSWAGEPLFGTPTRGELASWYSSRAVTTAFCYHALKTYLTTKTNYGLMV